MRARDYKTIFFAAIILMVMIFHFTTIAFGASVTLQWDPNDPTPDGYRVFSRTVNGVYDYTQPLWEGQEVTATVTVPDGINYFVVRAYAGTLESADSIEVRYESPAQSVEMPQRVAGLDVTEMTDTTITLSWTPQDGVTYEAFIAQVSGDYPDTPAYAGQDPAATFTGLTEGEQYKMRVRAKAGSVLGLYSGELLATVQAPIPPTIIPLRVKRLIIEIGQE